MIDYEIIGLRVKHHRIRNKFSQEDLADMIGMSRISISCLERGERLPSLDSLVNLANALQVSANDLLGENLLYSEGSICGRELDILSDCSPNEQAILLACMEEFKKVLRSYKISK